MDPLDIHGEMDRVRADFRRLVDGATVRELRRTTYGTRWTNEQLLFHMLFGYLLVRNLLVSSTGSRTSPTGSRVALRPRSTPAPARSTSSTTSDPSAGQGCWGMPAWNA